MKKSVFFASLLAGLLLVGCGKTEASSNSSSTQTPSSQTSSSQVSSNQNSSSVTSEYQTVTYAESIEATATKVADFDLTTIIGQWTGEEGNDGIHYSEPEIKSEFTNTVTNGVTLKSVLANDGVEKGQTSQGPRTGGLKLNCAYGGALTFTFENNKTVDYAEFVIRGWENVDNSKAYPFTVSINDNIKKFDNLTAGETISVIVKGEDLTKINIKSIGKDKKDSRPVITGIKFYNK